MDVPLGRFRKGRAPNREKDHLVIPPHLKHALSEVREISALQDLWHSNARLLQGYTFVLSRPTGAQSLWLPARADFESGGHLRSVFAHDHLYFINNAIASQMASKSTATIGVDYTVAFDSNAASYLRAWHQERSKQIVEMLGSVLQTLRSGRFNWDLFPYLLERAAAIDSNEDLTKIFETVLAAQWFAACDQETYRTSGRIVHAVLEQELVRRAQVELADWDRCLKSGGTEEIGHRHGICRVCILKMIELQLENPRRDAAAKKMAAFLRFLDLEMAAIPFIFVRAAIEYFTQGTGWKPMAKVAMPSVNLLRCAKNVAWDFTHLIWRQEFAGFNGRRRHFLVPYILTFDSGLAELNDLWPQRSCVFGGDIRFPLFFPDANLGTVLMGKFPEIESIVAGIFNIDAAEKRSRKRLAGSSPVEKLIQELEAHLATFVEA